ncbi:thymidylate synthase [Wenyingzhuangia aestuarii]|uniref:thymidylate synthase n=1 Tax=Wenyingzhuangia aestuarii TaxID=1647582 RepID=UPI00143ADFD4|nr:thymidylate synthase [Wenyingzhuangia aestuarii]NJB83602.1 thymidylate synthase [Wenyingzhuangia aestuarii]
MNKYHKLLSEIVTKGELQTNKKGAIKYLLNQILELQKGDLLEVFEDHAIARNKLKQELDLFTLGVERVEEYNEAGISWWNYCGERLKNSYPKYFEKLPELIDKINDELRSSKNYVLFLGENGVETNQQPCVSLIQFQINNGGLSITAYLRSSDASLGLPSDIYHLWLISRKIGLPLNNITLMLANVHIYENNLTNTKRLLRGDSVRFSLNV